MTNENDTGGDFTAHRESYDRFMWWLKTGAIAVVIVAAIAIFAITR